MQWLKQIRKSNCGQTAVAVVTGMSLIEIESCFAHTHATRTKELIRVLRAYGYSTPGRAVSPRVYNALFKRQEPVAVIAKLRLFHDRGNGRRRMDNRSHWVVINPKNGHILDGAYGNEKGEVYWPAGCRITSYIPIYKNTAFFDTLTNTAVS